MENTKKDYTLLNMVAIILSILIVIGLVRLSMSPEQVASTSTNDGPAPAVEAPVDPAKQAAYEKQKAVEAAEEAKRHNYSQGYDDGMYFYNTYGPGGRRYVVRYFGEDPTSGERSVSVTHDGGVTSKLSCRRPCDVIIENGPEGWGTFETWTVPIAKSVMEDVWGNKLKVRQ